MAADPNVEARRRAEEERKWRRNQNAAAQKEAERELHKIELDRIKARERAEKERIAAARAADKAAADEEREILSAPVRRRTGATRKNASAVIVWHWLAEPPTAVVMQQRRRGLGPLIALKPGGGRFTAADAVYDSLKARYPDIAAEHPDYVTNIRKALTETHERYGSVLTKLGDDGAMAELFESAEVCLIGKSKTTEVGEYGSYSREVTTVDVPELIESAIEPDGLVLIYRHRPGDSSKRWFAKIDLIRNMFRSLGVDAKNLRVVDDAAGNIRLCFDDAPSAFPSVIAPEPADRVLSSLSDAITARRNARWMVGVDARGRVLAPKINQAFPHALVVAGTGGGKSVFCRTLIESLRVGTASHDGGAQAWQFLIGDGKRTDYKSLVGQPGILMVSSEAAQHVVLVHRAWTEMHTRYHRAEKALEMGTGREEAFAFPPMLVLLDELAIMRKAVRRMKGSSEEFFVNEIDEILKLAREVNIVLVISSQDIRVENIDGAWQENFKLVISLGQPSTRTLMSDCWGDDESKEKVKRIGSRITAPGRGVIVQKSEDGKSVVTEFQSFMGYSPGAMDMSSAPTEEVRKKWEAAAAMAAQMPRLYPRLGIDVDGPEWRDEEAEVIATTAKVVALDGKDGALPSRARFDVASPEWVGKKASGVLGLHDEIAWAEDSDPVDPEPNTDQALTEDSLLAALGEAQRRGLIPPSTATDDVTGEV